MSTKNNALIGAAALALGFTVTAGALPICEGLLNDITINSVGMAETDTVGRVMLIVETKVGTVITARAVADHFGNVRTYATADAALAVVKKMTLPSGLKVGFVRMDKVGTIGDPLAVLKSKYKSYKIEAAAGLKQGSAVTSKVTAAVGLGWDTATGTPENDEYLDLVIRGQSIAEWKAFCDGKVTALAAALTAAGVDPLTVV
jgi:hypothetical protein